MNTPGSTHPEATAVDRNHALHLLRAMIPHTAPCYCFQSAPCRMSG